MHHDARGRPHLRAWLFWRHPTQIDGARMTTIRQWGLTLGLALRLPVVWLALGMFAALLAACVLTVVLALGQSDGALPNMGERVLSVPAVRAETQE